MMDEKELTAAVVEECIDKIDRLMLNTIKNPKIETSEKIEAYLQCIRDAKEVLRSEMLESAADKR